METWSYWMFGMLAADSFIRMLCLSLRPYPRERTRGMDLADLFTNVGFIVWGLIVLW